MIGYYVHHHGGGHRARFEKIRHAARTPIVPLSELSIEDGVLLSSDTADGAHDHTAGGALHWAPIGPALSRRGKTICDWVVQNEPVGAVVDVSVEAALLFRLLGVATVVVRQHGDRTDTPHVAAYASARRLLAPFPEELEHPDTPPWIVEKTDYAGFVTPPSIPGSADSDHPSRDDVVVLWGRGGGRLSQSALCSIAAAARPGRLWCIGHPVEPIDARSADIVDLGWRRDVDALLTDGPTVVTSAGNNTVADSAAAGCALVVIALDRPFGEQVSHTESLDRAQVAAVGRDTANVQFWRRCLATAVERRAALASLSKPNGASRAARLIEAAFA